MLRLETNIRRARREKDILLMTHLVLGYPSFEANREVIRRMVDAGVDLIELQIPFSEPMADGPVILKANQRALAGGARVADCFAVAGEMVREHPIPFLFMTYYNILYKHGGEAFLEKTAAIGIQGLIVPDLPPEEGGAFLRQAKGRDIAPILIYAPTSTDARMRILGETGAGFIYCVARRGVTGSRTAMDDTLTDYLKRCRAATSLPLAVGFGISGRDDVAFLKGKADIAVIGTKTIRLIEEQGTAAVTPFITGLR